MFRKIIKAGWEKFSHDKSSSGAALVVMMAALLVVTFLFFLNGTSNFVVTDIRNSIDVSTYFKQDTAEDDIAKLKSELLTLPEVKAVSYVSKDAAYQDFVAQHQNDQTILDSLQTIGTNPFLAALYIQANDPSQYQKIVDFVQQTPFASLIQKIDYQERTPVIERVSALSRGIQLGVLVMSIVLAIITILVVFNTTRLTILNSKEEIEIMRLVGASNWFIQGPFLVQGIIVGLIGAVSIFLLALLFAMFLSSKFVAFLSGFSLARYFWSHLWLLILLQLGVGIGLGVVSSLIAIRKYLKV